MKNFNELHERKSLRFLTLFVIYTARGACSDTNSGSLEFEKCNKKKPVVSLYIYKTRVQRWFVKGKNITGDVWYTFSHCVLSTGSANPIPSSGPRRDRACLKLLSFLCV